MNYQSLSPNIGVKSVPETVKFYTEKLGFQLAMSHPEQGDFVWAMVSSGLVSMMFQEVVSLKEEYPQLEGKADNGILTFYVKMQGMFDLYERLKGTSCVVKEMHKTFYGADEFAIQDNNGYILTIAGDGE